MKQGMDKYPRLRKCLAVGIILVFFGIAIAPSINFTAMKASNDNDLMKEGKANHAKRTHFFDHSPKALLFFNYPFFTYPSSIIIVYDEEYVNQTAFTANMAYSIPVSIGYRVWVPDWIFNSSFPFLKNWYLFHSLIPPMMVINLTVENVPTWADIYLASPNIIVEITNEFRIIPDDVIVGIHNQAPKGPFTFSLHAEAAEIHRIVRYVCSRDITITVQ
jgi:hypothetical protein